MNAPEPPPPRPGLLRALRWVGAASALVFVSTMAVIAWFAWQTERAHDEAACPFEPTGEVRPVGADRVVERSRACVPGIAEHRFDLVSGETTTEVGRRRLPLRAWEGHTWSAEVVDAEVTVTVTPAGGQPFRVGAR